MLETMLYEFEWGCSILGVFHIIYVQCDNDAMKCWMQTNKIDHEGFLVHRLTEYIAEVDLHNNPAVCQSARPEDRENGSFFSWLCQQAINTNLVWWKHFPVPCLTFICRVPINANIKFAFILYFSFVILFNTAQRKSTVKHYNENIVKTWHK